MRWTEAELCRHQAGEGDLESKEQQKLIDWAHSVRLGPQVPGSAQGRRITDYLYAVPNGAHLAGGRKRRAIQMSRLKREGLKEGVSDLHFVVPMHGECGLFLELKREVPISIKAPASGSPLNASPEHQRLSDWVVDQLSEDQMLWLTQVSGVGHAAVMACGFDSAVEAITDYLTGAPRDEARPTLMGCIHVYY